MAVALPIEDYANSMERRNNERLERLRARDFQNLQQPSNPQILFPPVEEYGAIKLLDPALYEAATKGDADNLIITLDRVSTNKMLSLSTIFNQVSPSGNSLLHEAASFGNTEITKLIAHHFSFLLTRRNIIGDTALHVAAKAGNLNTIEVLIYSYPDDQKQFLQMRNQIGNTALHEAVIRGHLDGVKSLFSAYPQMAHYPNMEGNSPLSLAVETENKDILVLLLEAPVGDGELVIVRPRDVSPVYAAIEKERLDMLEEIKNKKPMLFHMRDEKGKTPLHFAASIGYLKGVHFLLENFSQSALEKSKKGDFPIHMACKKGHVKVVKELLQQWPNPTELLNNEGQNILHVAAKNGRKDLVQVMLRKPQLGTLLNVKDSNGNTPLHLASMNLHPNVLVSLTWDKRVDLKLKNKDGLTAMDLFWEQHLDSLKTIRDFRKLFTIWVLRSAGTPLTGKGRNFFRRKNKEEEPPKMDDVKDKANLLALVSILVATVTFAAGFTVPGGFKSSDKVTAGQGMAILVNRNLFHLFIICDTMAMFSSIIATFILLWVLLGDFYIALSAYIFARIFSSIALFMMSLAFMSAVYLVVSELPWLANAVLIIGIIFIAILFFLNLLLIFPFGFQNPVSHFCCHYTIPLMIHFTGSYGKVVEDKEQKKSQPVKDDKQEELQEMK